MSLEHGVLASNARGCCVRPSFLRRVSVGEVIRVDALNGAVASRQEKVKGSIAAGKLPDLVVLSRNLGKIAPRDILSVRVRYTLSGDHIVYSGDSDAH